MDYGTIFRGIFDILVAIICIILIPELKKWLTAKTSSQIADRAAEIIDTLVAAAQQIYDSNEGAEKKEYVLKNAVAKLKDIGIELDTSELNNMIEAAVLKLHNSLKA